MYWPKLLIHKTKQRLTKMTQMRIRMRKLALKTREKIVTNPRKENKREARREVKAENAALVDKAIVTELTKRIPLYQDNDIYNYPSKAFNKALEELQPVDEEEEVEFVEEEDDMEDFGVFGMNDSQDDYDDDENADNTEDEVAEAVAKNKAKRKTDSTSRTLDKGALDSKSKKAKVLVEVEREDDTERQRVVQ